MSSNNKTCETCVHFDDQSKTSIGASRFGSNYGICRRHPPSAAAALTKTAASCLVTWPTWPVVNVDDWCGEHQASDVSDDLADLDISHVEVPTLQSSATRDKGKNKTRQGPPT